MRWHWSDRGSLYDFLYTTRGQGKKLLDFGSGDGWPSLLVAPFVKEVVGVVAAYSGSMAAARLFDSYAADNRPSVLKSVDEAIRKVVKIVTELDPMITGIK